MSNWAQTANRAVPFVAHLYKYSGRPVALPLVLALAAAKCSSFTVKFLCDRKELTGKLSYPGTALVKIMVISFGMANFPSFIEIMNTGGKRPLKVYHIYSAIRRIFLSLE